MHESDNSDTIKKMFDDKICTNASAKQAERHTDQSRSSDAFLIEIPIPFYTLPTRSDVAVGNILLL